MDSPFAPRDQRSVRLGRLYRMQRSVMHHIFWEEWRYDVPEGERRILVPNERYTDRRCKLLYAIQDEIHSIEEELDFEHQEDEDIAIEYRIDVRHV